VNAEENGAFLQQSETKRRVTDMDLLRNNRAIY
jgi:hypothetical protein